MKIVVDSGNGIPGASAPGILRALGCEVTELYSEVDGDFPNHHPDPSKPENLAELIATVQATGAELGLAFDGDGDRLGVVTRDGKIIYPDRQLMLLAQRRAGAPPGRHGDLRRQVQPAPGAGDPRGRWRAADVEDRPFADQGQDEGNRRADRRRDERPHLLRRALVRLRRRHLHRRAHAGDPVAQQEPEPRAERPADQLQHARAQRALRRGRASRAGGRAAGARGRRPAGFCPAARSAPSTACASTSPTASA